MREVASAVGASSRPCDLTDPDDLQGLITWLDSVGPPDTLILNAGVGWAGLTPEMPFDRVTELIELNLQAPILLSVRLLPRMLARGDGRILLVSSIAGCLGVREEAVYSATKAGLRAFASSLRWELAGSGVTVTVVVPGAVATPFFARRGRHYDRDRPRPLPPERVAEAVARHLDRPVPEVFVPGWLRLPARLSGGMPGLTAALARRFG
jgi:short-subunit dehydrogenase